MSMMALDIKKKFSARSDRVKCVDVHPTEPWVVVSLYDGNIYLYNYVSQQLVKQFEVTDQPIRCVKFVARKQWIVAAADDMQIRIYNYNTMECVKKWEAHTDYIRSLAVHPTQPYILSCSDDWSIKLWNWDKDCQLVRTFEGHNHYVMMVVFNPKDLNTFASASLDKTVKVWNLGSRDPNFTLEGHGAGVNSVDYFPGGDKPYVVTGADDKTVKVWDYQTKACVATLEGHGNNVSCAVFHPELPLIISGSEDGSVRIWNNTTYKLEKPLNYGWERVWALGVVKGANVLAVGFDEGTILLKLGKEYPAASMDSGGKLLVSKHNQLLGCNLAQYMSSSVQDGERLPVAYKELGNCEFYPKTIKHSWNGRFIVAAGDGEYVIYTALQVRNKSFGSALDFIWSRAGAYAVRESSSKIKVFDNFEEQKQFRPDFSCEGIFGGELIAARSSSFVCLYDWKEMRLIRKIEVTPKAVYWNESGDHLVIATDASFYVLKYNRELVQSILDSNRPIEEDGIEEAFDVLHEIPERIRTACWVGDCFMYTNSQNILRYTVGSKTDTVAHLDRTMYLLGYLPKFGRVFLIDKSQGIVSYTLRLAIINYQTAVIRGDMKTAEEILPSIQDSERTKIAQFLDAQGLKEKALEITNDNDHKFDLAVQLGRLDYAYEIAKQSDTEHKWKVLSDMAMQELNFQLSEECMWQANDLNGLLLLFSSNGSAEGMSKLAARAKSLGKFNVAFNCLLLLGQVDECIELLVQAGRVPEAAIFARSYAPSRIADVVKIWKDELAKSSPRVAEAIADPLQYPNLFPGFEDALEAEQRFSRKQRFADVPAVHWPQGVNQLQRDLIEDTRAKREQERQQPPPQPQQQAPSSPATSRPVRPSTPTRTASSARVATPPAQQPEEVEESEDKVAPAVPVADTVDELVSDEEEQDPAEEL